MANKQKKKRNKVYTGVDAAIERPVVTRISAVNRSRIGQWWFDHKKVARPILITAAIVIGVTWLIIELFRIASN
jgi:hypothetical protein